MSRQEPTRREFLRSLARGAVYATPVITTFVVAPDLLAQVGSPPGHHHMHATAPAQPAQEPATPSPSERHPPPSKKDG